MKIWIIISFALSTTCLFAQKAEDFGFRHLQYVFENDTIDVLIKSKKGDENKKKPLFFSVQGSTAKPLIVHNGKQRINLMLVEGFVEEDFHLVIVNKPGLPLMCNKERLSKRGRYFENKLQKRFPKQYLEKNYLNYYVKRNVRIIDSLLKKNWVDSAKLVVSGHSQGSSIVAEMADKNTAITHLIYSSGLPYYSTILDILHEERMNEDNEENPYVQKTIDYWKNVVERPLEIYRPSNDEYQGWDSNLMMYSFSPNENELLKRLKIPVLISYGTKDRSSPYQDMFRVETIKDRIDHITFNAYVGLGHNYQLVKPDKDKPNQKIDYLETVVTDWLTWLNEN